MSRMLPLQLMSKRCRPPTLHFLVPGSINRPTGGSRYDREIVNALIAQGHSVAVTELTGQFPGPDQTAAQAVEAALNAIESNSSVIVDGLVLGGLPESFAPHAQRLELIALVHHPLCLESGLSPQAAEALQQREKQALSYCRKVIATSEHTRLQLAALDLYQDTVITVEPGCAPAPLSTGGHADQIELICVGSITPRKGQDVLVEALSQISDDAPAWHCQLIGSTELAPAFAQNVSQQIEHANLAHRVTLAGALEAAALTQAYATADCLILPSRYEGYGMVVTEAIARGLPIITTTAGALVDTLPPHAGIAVNPNDAAALKVAIQSFLSDALLQQRLRDGAREARQHLTPWSVRGQAFSDALTKE